MIHYEQDADYSWIAKDGDKVIAHLELTDEIEDEYSDYYGCRILQNISVEKDYRKQGIATELLKKALSVYEDLLFDTRPHFTANDDGNGTFLRPRARIDVKR